MKKTRRQKTQGSRAMMMGALVASATFTTRAATPLHAAERPKLRYEEAIADVLRTMRISYSHAAPEAQARVSEQFNIVPGPLGGALAAFEALTGITVTVASPTMKEIHSPGASGVYTPEQALQQLLAGTNLAYRFTRPNAVSIDVPGRSEFVEVAASPAPVVSSPKFTTPLRDIPQTITVISSDVIQAQGGTTLRDVLRNVPSLTFQAGEGGGGLPGDNLTMRGFSAGNDMFIDGVRDPGGYSRDAFNLEQVEVVKGPSSSIAGRGSTGGAINQVSKTPNLSKSRTGVLGIGNADFRRGTFDVNQPLPGLGDGVAFRLNGMWTDSGVPGRDVVENGSWGLAPSVAFGLTGPTRITLKSQHLRQDNVPDYGLPWGSSPGFPTGAFEATPPIDQGTFYGLRDYDFENIDSDVATVDVNHRFAGGATLRNLSRYSNTSRDSAITAPRPPNRQLQRRTMGNENIAN